ncbi:cytochrome ubiquinol oxidase subunit I [Natrinema salifodinae]|uniref:Cytochrome bd-I ubiquinol oxidase subunit 1 apoprotein n=1 Tax=Natrinema salifodinae TaxID=1202768 RepID=A0A1I0PEK1_9EURY|nr:cytochrome ubiquinol oxidase subunit I [Natrinema salifodinae]SEW12739.1 cytochrome bd-I ubiquinol oxidase subunit 1 apoprotein [Natrinema salifodinae]
MVDPVIASRLQFALTTIVHIIFPVMSMGLAPFLIYFTWKSIRSSDPLWERQRRFWTHIFAISFVVGTVTGLVLEFEFGTNFAAFSTFAGELFGGPLAVEGMMAFFLEATFLGVFVFGREKVGDALYMVSAVAVGLGTWLSAVWVLVANSWMQTPRGYELARESGQPVVTLVDPVAAYLNPRFPWMFVHMQSAAVLSVALFMAGVAAYFVYRSSGGERENGTDGDDTGADASVTAPADANAAADTAADDDARFWRTTLKIALVVLLLTAPFQVVHGDSYGRHVAETQPQKFAAMEALYETEGPAALHLIAIPTDPSAFTDPRAENLWTVDIPAMASVLASGGDPSHTVQGLDEFEGSPPVAIVFWAFRAMVLLGFWFVGLAAWAAYRWRRGDLFADRHLHRALMASAPLGFVAVETGWIVTEVGRQPWVVQGLLRTEDGVSPGLTGAEATLTLAGFALVYAALLGGYGYVVRRLILAGPPDVESAGSTSSASPTDPNAESAAPKVTGDD